MTAPILLASDLGEHLLWLGPIYEGTPPDPDIGAAGATGLGLFYPASGNPPYPAQWVKTTRAGAWAGPYTAPAGAPGAAGPAGALAPWVAGTAYTADTSTVLVRGSIWQAITSHTAGSTFEGDAVAGKWRPVGQKPVETFSPYLATSAQAIATGTSPGTPRTVYQRCDGGGVITKLLTWCIAAGGTVGLGVQRASSGPGSAPGTTQAFYGTVTPTANSLVTVTISGGLVVYPGDYLFIFSDNSSATYYATGTTSNGTFSELYPGTTYFAQTSPPQVTGPGSSSYAPYRGPLIVGRP